MIIALPERPVMLAASVARRVRALTSKQYLQVKGLFKNTFYDSSATESDLGLSFVKNSVCVIGAGAYGSYTINALCERYPDANITLFDVGDVHVKSEKEIGYKSNLFKSAYTGLSKGRFFGFGGATAKWGGQLLMFSHNDFQSPNQYLSDVVELNEKYRNAVFKRFGIDSDFEEKHVTSDLFTKTGIWLSYFSRNLFSYFKIGSRKNVRILQESRVTRILTDGRSIVGVQYLQEGKIKNATFDHYFLTAGAFECNRILIGSGLTEKSSCSFSDHLSQKVFKIKGTTLIGSEDYAFGVRGASLVTKRMIGEIDGVSFFGNPIYNSQFPFFQNLKQILFKHQLRLSVIKSVLADIPSVLAFAWSMIIRKSVCL